jgi:uncharacterized protein
MAKRKAAAEQGTASVGGTAPADSVYIGQSTKPEFIYLRLANRHGLITGATGTGKTVTLQGLAEGFSNQGVPVFCADVKSDLSGIAEMGPLLLSRLMDLSEAQEGVLNIAFRISDEEKLLLLDLKDLQALLQNLAERAGELTTKYGNITKASVGSVQRALLGSSSRVGRISSVSPLSTSRI